MLPWFYKIRFGQISGMLFTAGYRIATLDAGGFGGEHAVPDRRLVVGTILWQPALEWASVRSSLPVMMPAVHGVNEEGNSISNTTPHVRADVYLSEYLFPSKTITISTWNGPYILCPQLEGL